MVPADRPTRRGKSRTPSSVDLRPAAVVHFGSNAARERVQCDHSVREKKRKLSYDFFVSLYSSSLVVGGWVGPNGGRIKPEEDRH
jgi:hypothetical protein